MAENSTVAEGLENPAATASAADRAAPGSPEAWQREYALLALRVNRQLTGDGGGTVLIYRGPEEWSARVANEEAPPPERLVDDADALLAEVEASQASEASEAEYAGEAGKAGEAAVFPPERARYLAAQVRALRAAARRLAGADLPLPAYAETCLGVAVDWVPEAALEEAHALLDAGLPRTPAAAGGPPGRVGPPGRGGASAAASLAERLKAWQAAHTLPAERLGRVPDLVRLAVAETRRRTATIVPLPDDEVVDCELASGVAYRAAGHYAGGVRSTIFVNRDLPFNLADLLYVVAHEGHPGHIAESLLKERHLVERRGWLDHQVRFMLAPSFVLSEGLGLHAESLIFLGDEAQSWVTDHVLAPEGIRPDGSDHAAIHRAQNILFGAWANAALLAGEGRPAEEVARYLTRWALLSESETGQVAGLLGEAGMGLYVFGYYHGWRLLDAWFADQPEHERAARVRRLLTEQLLPADVAECGAAPEATVS